MPFVANKIFVGGLSSSTDDRNFRRYFEQFGRVKEATVMRDPHTRRSRGFGFITFSTEKEMQFCLAKSRHSIDGK